MQELNLLILISESIVLPLHQLAIMGHMVRLELTSIVALSIIFPIITIQALPIKLHAPYNAISLSNNRGCPLRQLT